MPTMAAESFRNEVSHLFRVKSLLEKDSILPIRLDVQRQSLDFSLPCRFKVTIRGLTSLIGNPSSVAAPTANAFSLAVEVPSGYPWRQIPQIRFEPPVPFHPHIYTHGGICWGSGNEPQPDLSLADWVRAVVEYLQYNQDPGSAFQINRSSPANTAARNWWVSHQGQLSRYVPPVNIGRLRFWIDQSRG